MLKLLLDFGFVCKVVGIVCKVVGFVCKVVGFVCKVVDVFVCLYLSNFSHSHTAPASAVLKLLLAQFKTRPLGL